MNRPNFENIMEGSSELAKNFDRKSVKVAYKTANEILLPCIPQKGDRVIDWQIKAHEPGLGYDEFNIYFGQALIREGKVHFYDRYPMGGGPFKISDFKDPKFRKRAELIAKNLESMIKQL